MARFLYKGSKYGGTPVTASYIIANSQVVKVGGWVNLTTAGFADGADAGEALNGVVIAVTNKDGIPVSESHSTEFDGTLVADDGTTPETYTAASDNQTDKKCKVLVNIDPFAIYSNEPDAAIGTTTSSGNSAFQGSYTDLVSDIQVDEDNNSASFATIAQLFILGLDPDSSARGLYMKAEGQPPL